MLNTRLLPLLKLAGVLALAVQAVLAALLHHLLRPGGRGGSPAIQPYERKDAFLTPSERSLYGVLEGVAAAQGLRVFARVRLEDLIEVHQGNLPPRLVDFVLCDREQLAPRLAIQLHETTPQGDPDEFVTWALSAAGLPSLWLPERPAYAPQEVASLIRETLALEEDRF